jgi:hypothetical protein
MTLTQTDKDTLARAIETARKDPAERRRVDDELASGEETWEDIGENCARRCQVKNLHLMPWQFAPMCYANHLDSALHRDIRRRYTRLG